MIPPYFAPGATIATSVWGDRRHLSSGRASRGADPLNGTWLPRGGTDRQAGTSHGMPGPKATAASYHDCPLTMGGNNGSLDTRVISAKAIHPSPSRQGRPSHLRVSRPVSTGQGRPI